MAMCHHDVKQGMDAFTPPLDVMSKRDGQHIALYSTVDDLQKDVLHNLHCVSPDDVDSFFSSSIDDDDIVQHDDLVEMYR